MSGCDALGGSAKPPVAVTAPMCVQSTFYQQENGKRTIVHLLNEINSTSNRALPVGSPPMREEIVPLSDIEVLFRDSSITRVHLEPEAQDLPIRKTSDGVEVTVPKLGLHFHGCCGAIASRKRVLERMSFAHEDVASTD